ncbi:hypothetical protein [Nocardia sp. NPDC050406]|uniref:hypothetical protein n=1 Tax=Nocardia sp. NPDC050406 TaxID=3364318 RepID=UPI0037B42A72
MTTWAKAPDFADRPERQAMVRAQTVEDKKRYLESGLTPLSCQSCGTEVLVLKHSTQQKTVQWTTNPADTCPVFRQLAANGPAFGKPDSCPNLEKTIDHAVAEGILQIED